jgi:hypothetical protein
MPVPVLLRRRRYLFLVLSLLSFCALWFSSFESDLGHSSLSGQAIVSLASSQARLDVELPITVLSLTRQTVAPKEIRVYFPQGDKGDVQKRVGVNSTDRPLPEHLLHPLVRILFAEDVGPATKFVPVIRELLSKVDAGSGPVIIVDDDHYYSPSLVSTLLTAHLALPYAALGFRGWRIRQDLQWGVSGDEFDRHVQYGWRLARPYRVGVLTANEGYLVVPRFFVPTGSSTPSPIPSATLIDAAKMAALGPAHLVDDIWMAGCLSSQGVPRYIVPLPGPPSLDVTVTHPLEAHMSKDGISRATANGDTLRAFGDAWQGEGIWYRFAKDVKRAKSVVAEGGSEADDEPVWISLLARASKEARKLIMMAKLKLLFKDIRFN